eukprot:1178278-Prorocentrum_minimum.AAC.2
MEELMNYQVKNESPFVATGAIPTDDKSVLLRANPARLLSGSYVSCELCSYVIRLLCFVQTLRVEMVSRDGIHRDGNFHERVSRTENYLVMEAWADSEHLTDVQTAENYYIADNVLQRPFVQVSDKIAYAANHSELLNPQPPTADLAKLVLELKDSSVIKSSIGTTGNVGMFVNRPGTLECSKTKTKACLKWVCGTHPSAYITAGQGITIKFGYFNGVVG